MLATRSDSDKSALGPPTRLYELKLIRFTPEATVKRGNFSSGLAASDWLGLPHERNCLIEAFVSQDGTSLGEFYLWCGGHHAHARINEHREHYASFADKGSNTVTFKNDDGSPFTPSGELIVPRDLAMHAIHSWLIDLKRPGFLEWS